MAPSRRLRLIVTTLVLAAMSIVVGASAAAAEPEVGIEVGYDGYAQAGRPYPVTVTVTSDVLVEGELRVVDAGGIPLARNQAIDVPPGTTRELHFVLESSPWDSGNPQVELVVDGEVLDKAATRPKAPRNGDLLGVLGSLATGRLPEVVPLGYEAGEAVVVPVDIESLALGWGSIAPLDMIATTAADLRDLDDADLDVLFTWVRRGGRLLVDEPTGTQVPGLPAAWQPGEAGHGAADLGEIVLTDGAMAAGRWASILEPAPTRSRSEEESFGEMNQMWGGEPLSWSLGSDAGFELPDLPWLITMLSLYVVVAGPLTWLVARRLRKPGLMWVAVPVVAVGFTAAIWVLGSSFRNSTETAHGTILDVGPRGTTATTFTLLHSTGGGTKSLELPRGWYATTSVNDGFPVALEVQPNGDGTSISTDLDAGAFALVGGTGNEPAFDDALSVTAQSGANGTVSGTVTNNLDHDLTDVAVFADQAGKKIGTVAAGESLEFEISSRPTNPMDGEPVEVAVWRNAISPEFFGGPRSDFEPGAVNIGLWTEMGQRWSINDRPVGQVLVAGWTDELASPLDPTVTAGRTLVLARGAIEASGGSLTDLAVSRSMVRSSIDLGASFRLVNGWGGGAMLRYVLPDDAPDGLVLTVPRGQERVDLWVDGQWRQLVIDPGDKAAMALPPEVIASGRVYVKVLLNFERSIPALREISVRSPAASEEVLATAYTAEPTEDDEGAAG